MHSISRDRMRLLWTAALVLFSASGSRAADAPADTEWAINGQNNTENHYSPLKQIDTDTVSRLGLGYSLDLPGEQTLEATPLEVGGMLYFSGQSSGVYAVDARTGSLLWKYDAELLKEDSPDHLRWLFGANRGVAYWKGRVYVGTYDGRLVALDAKTGTVIWSERTFPLGTRRYIAGMPAVVNGKILIGNGGADTGERGFVTAYDGETGKQLWRFYTAPGSPEENATDPIQQMAAKTWGGEYWKTGTGGSVWNGMTFDPETNRVYIGTGNSGPYNPSIRSPGGGDNLFLASIVALDADTGRYLWHYQVNPREAWDFKASANMILADLKIGGAVRRVIMQAPTNGFYYVLDRDTGKLISAEKTGKVTWASRIDLATGRPVEAPNIRYETGEFTMFPGVYGAHNWQPMSYDPDTGLAYIPYMQLGSRYQATGTTAIGAVAISNVLEDKEDGKGKLLAWDPVKQKSRWSVPRSSIWNGGIVSTGGNLVFQGTEEGKFEAYDARDGRKVWSFDAKLGIIAAPITYALDGKQYVSILVGYGGGVAFSSAFHLSGWKYGLQPRRLLTFVLDGKAALPATPPSDTSFHVVDDPSLVIDEAKVQAGAELYGAKNCLICHGYSAVSAGAPGPDLRESNAALSRDTFRDIIKKGVLADHGMPRYSELSDPEIEALYVYIRAQAREALGKRQAPRDDASGSRF